MADVASSFKNWSSSAASNLPTSSTTIGAGLAPNLQQIQATVRTELGARSASVTAASSTDIGAKDEGTVLISHVGGTVAISSFGTVSAGIKKLVTFSVTGGNLSLIYNATSMIVPSAANITVENGDSLFAESLGSGNWKIHSYSRASGNPLNQNVITLTNDPTLSNDSGNPASTDWINKKALINLGSLINTSGSAVYEFNSIPGGVKKINVILNEISTNGSSIVQLQLGTSSGVENSGYISVATNLQNSAGVGVTSITSGFHCAMNLASENRTGTFVLTLQNGSTWICSSNTVSTTGIVLVSSQAGSKTLSGVIDRIRLTTVNGTDLFDAGTASISWEY